MLRRGRRPAAPSADKVRGRPESEGRAWGGEDQLGRGDFTPSTVTSSLLPWAPLPTSSSVSRPVSQSEPPPTHTHLQPSACSHKARMSVSSSKWHVLQRDHMGGNIPSELRCAAGFKASSKIRSFWGGDRKWGRASKSRVFDAGGRGGGCHGNPTPA